jgi:hypothetical protein
LFNLCERERKAQQITHLLIKQLTAALVRTPALDTHAVANWRAFTNPENTQRACAVLEIAVTKPSLKSGIYVFPFFFARVVEKSLDLSNNSREIFKGSLKEYLFNQNMNTFHCFVVIYI